MQSMFRGALAFNQDIKTANTVGWQTDKVQFMQFMFEGAKAFDKPITNWDTTAVTNMASMFQNAEIFNQDIKNVGNAWKTDQVQNMEAMFKDAKKFNKDLKNWIVTAVTNNGGNTATWMFTGTNSDAGGFATNQEPCKQGSP